MADAEQVAETNTAASLMEQLGQACLELEALKNVSEDQVQWTEILSVIRDELPIALESASEPARLVLDSLEGFFPTYQSFEPVNLNDAALRGMRQSCIAFLQATVTFLAKADHGPDYFLTPEIKQQAKAIADEWKASLVRLGLNVVNSNNELEAEAFLLLLATFKFASEFDEEELCKFVLVDAANRQTPEVCRSLGLAHKIPDVVEVLINTGRRVEAVHFIQAFNLTERFPIVPLLKTYLKDMRRNSQGKKGGNSQTDVNAQELEALTAVVRCITEYKLESEYPLEPLRKRLAQLERSKTAKKRSMDYYSKYLPSKKVRSNGGFLRHRGCAVTASVMGSG